MSHPDLAVVTGAFGYTGRHVARRLLDRGVCVRTLTRRHDRANAFGGRVDAAPLDFSDWDGLCRSLEGAGVLYNTYWVRFARGRTTFDLAVENSTALFEAAAQSGRRQNRPFLRHQRRVRLPAALLQGQRAGGRSAEARRRPLRHHQADPGLWGRRHSGQQHRLGAAPLSGLPGLWQRRLSRATRVRRRPRRNRPWRPAPNVETSSRTPPGRTRCPSRRCCACWHPPQWASAAGWCTRPRRSASALTGLVGLLMRDVVLTRDEIAGLMAGLLTSRCSRRPVRPA